MNFISRNLAHELTLDEIAEAASFSPFHFHRIFKAVVGETVAAFTRRLRLEKAANRLISRPGDDITAIAIDCGFSSSQNFARVFVKHFGLTPTAFRKSKIGNMDHKPGNELSLSQGYHHHCTVEHLMAIDAVEVRNVPAMRVAYLRQMGPYTQAICEPQFGELMAWAAPRGLIGPGKVMAIYWDNPMVTPPEKCRFDAGIQAPDETAEDDRVAVQTIPGGPYAVCRFERPPEEIRQAWNDALVWFKGSGLECSDQPCYEIYLTNAAEHPQGKWVFEIRLPIIHGI